MTPSNVCDRFTISKIVVRTRDPSELDSVGEHGRVVEADDCNVVVQDGVNVLGVHNNPADSVDGTATVCQRTAKNYSPIWNSVPTVNNTIRINLFV